MLDFSIKNFYSTYVTSFSGSCKYVKGSEVYLTRCLDLTFGFKSLF